jgi:hypothetical protein
MATRTRKGIWLAAVLSLTLLFIVSPAQAKHKDDGDVIHCKDLASCLALIPAPGGDSDLSGTDASNLGIVGDDVPDPPADDGDNSSSTTPSATTPAASPTATVPQVVTVPTQPASRAATTTTVAPAPKLSPICINRPEFGQGPLQPGWIKNADGTCSIDVCPNIGGPQTQMPTDDWGDPMIKDARGDCVPKYRPASINWCTKQHQYMELPVDQVAAAQLLGYTPAVMVEGFGPMCLLTDIVTYQGNPDNYFKTPVFVGDDPSYFPRFACQQPFGADMPAPLYAFYAHKGETVTPTAKEEPGCKPAAKAKVKVKRHVRRHLSKKNQRRH